MELNCIGDTCPLPVIKTKKALETMEKGLLTVATDNPEAVENVEKLIKSLGLPYTIASGEGKYTINITKGDAAQSQNHAKVSSGTIVVISSDKMGEGSEELGHSLLKTFIYTLTEAATLPKSIIFYNGGVKMATQGSTALNDLSKLSEMGVDILSCGACLNYYNLTAQLEIGRITNMYEIAETMLNAANIVKP